MSNSTTNETMLALCPPFTEAENAMVANTAFYIDGVAKTTVAVLGVASNILAGYVLCKPNMKNSFNLCLVALAWIDTIFLVGSILESFRKRFGLSTNVQMMLYPHVLYPLFNISLTASIYQIVAITMERYCAVHYPVNYRQAANDPKLMRNRLCRYLVPVIFLSILINISKFFEVYVAETKSGDYKVSVSWLRLNTVYSAITNWMRLIFMSALPLLIIVFFNFKVYKDVKERSQRSFERKSMKIVNSTKVKETKSPCINMELRPLAENIPPATTPEPEPSVSFNTSANGGNEGIKPANQGDISPKDVDTSPTLILEVLGVGSNVKSGETRRATEDRLAVIFLVIILAFIFCHLPRVAIDIHEIITINQTNFCKEAKTQNSKANIFPAWSFVAIYISHFCLVINATLNMYIYCFMSPLFREEVWQVFQDFKPNFCKKKDSSKT